MPDDNAVKNPFLSSNDGATPPPVEPVAEPVSTPVVEPSDSVAAPVNPFLVNKEPVTVPAVEPAVEEVVAVEETPVIEAEVASAVEENDIAEKKLEEELEEIEEDKNLKEEILTLLKQAGIGKGCLVGALAVGAVAIVLILFFSYGMDFISGSGGKVENEAVVEEEEDVKTSSSELQSAYQFGESPTIFGFEGGYLSVYGAFAVGRDLTAVSEGFVAYTDLLLQMQNIYEIDLYAMLDGSADRRNALANHLAVMKDLIERGDIMMADLQQRQLILQGQFDAATNNKTLLEENFYTSLKSLYGNQAFVYLNSFVDFSKITVETKAYFSAYKTLEEMYVNSLGALKLRYQDIAANTEALVKGIKVMDIPGSDIKVIIRLGTSNQPVL